MILTVSLIFSDYNFISLSNSFLVIRPIFNNTDGNKMDLQKRHSLASKYSGTGKVCLIHKAEMAFSIQVPF